MIKFLSKLLTRKGTKIPVYRVYFDIEQHKLGKLSFKAFFHPSINKELDETKRSEIHVHLKAIGDIMRENVDLDNIM